MKLGPASLAALSRVERADTAYREAKVKLEGELRKQLEEKLKGLEWERARAVRDADTTMKRENGRSNVAAISRAIHSQDHATAKSILAMTEDVKELISKEHPDDFKISLDEGENPQYHFIMENGETYSFRIIRGEYVGVNPTQADELDNENAIARIAEWEARRKA